MANKNTKDEVKNEELNPVDLGLEEAPVKDEVKKDEVVSPTTENIGIITQEAKPATKPVEEPVDDIFTRGKEPSYEEKKLEAAAAQAVKTAAEANANMSLRESERTYAIAKRKHMLERCKNDRLVVITPSKMLASIFGATYTFNYNGIPVTVHFNGMPQKFPKFIADKIQKKIYETSEANTPKEVIETM